MYFRLSKINVRQMRAGRPQVFPAGSNDENHDTFPVKLGNIDDYSIITRVGRGKYSNVFCGRTKDGDLCVIKVLKPVRIGRIEKEIQLLKCIRDGPNICHLQDVVLDKGSGSIALVLDWQENTMARDIKNVDIPIYIYKVLEALSFAHAKDIMHRDVKPGNIVFDSTTKQLRLIDWGLADYYHQHRDYPVGVATRHYKGPELLLGFRYYNMSLDIWGLGCTLASLIFRRFPFFEGTDNDAMLIRISEPLGCDAIVAYAKKYELEIPGKVMRAMKKNTGKPWSAWITRKNRLSATSLAIDLLSKMMIVDHKKRPTADELMEHPFFDGCRDV